MEAKKFEALLTSIELGSFTKAAKELGYTQSGLTHMMNALENELGFPLLIRSNAGVRLTENGYRLLGVAKEFVQAEKLLQTEVERIKSAKTQTIQIGAYASLAAHLLPAIIRTFQNAHPDITVEIRMGTVGQLRTWLADGQVDLVFGSNVGFDQQWLPLGKDPFVAVLPEDYPLENNDAFPIEQFNHKEFIMPADGFDLDIIKEMNHHQVKPTYKSTQVDDPAVISMVEHSLGITVLTKLILKGDTHKVKVLPLFPKAHREIGIAYPQNAESSPGVRKFLACVKTINLPLD